MDWTNVIVALIAGLSSAFCAILANRKSQAVFQQRMEDRINSLEEKVEKHNQFSDKISTMQTDIAVIRTNIQHLSERIP